MRKNKIICLVVILCCVTALVAGLSACKEDDPELSIFDQTALIGASGTSVNVTVTRGSTEVYSYKNGKVSNPYNLDVKPSDYIGDMTENGAVKLQKDYLTEGYRLEYDETEGEVFLHGTLTSTVNWLGKNIDGANVTIKANLMTKELELYEISYKTGDFDVVISITA